MEVKQQQTDEILHNGKNSGVEPKCVPQWMRVSSYHPDWSRFKWIFFSLDYKARRPSY